MLATKSPWVLEEISTIIKIWVWLPELTGSRFWIRIRGSQGSRMLPAKGCRLSKVLWVPSFKILKHIINKIKSRQMELTYSSSLRWTTWPNSPNQAKEPNLTAKISFKNPTKIPKVADPRNNKSQVSQNQKTLTQHSKSRWGPNKRSSPRTSSNTRKTYWSNWIAMRCMRNSWGLWRRGRLFIARWRRKRGLNQRNKIIRGWASIRRHSSRRILVLSLWFEAMLIMFLRMVQTSLVVASSRPKTTSSKSATK